MSLTNGGKVVDVYALIDPGSTCTFITDKICQTLQLPSREETTLDVRFLSTTEKMIVSKTSVDISPFRDLLTSFHISTVYSTPLINIPAVNHEAFNRTCQQFPHLQHISFPAVRNGEIHMILGVNSFAFTYPITVLNGNRNEPFAIKTSLGWTFTGEYRGPQQKSQGFTGTFYTSNAVPSRNPHSPIDLNQFWVSEKMIEQPAKKAMSEDDETALKLLTETTQFIGDRYEVGLLWKPKAVLPNNYYAAHLISLKV